MSDKKARIEEFEVRGEEVVSKVKELLHEGNIRRISLQTEEGRTLIEVPLTVGVAGAAAMTMLAPVWAAIGAIAALVADLNLIVERIPEDR